ncbi:NAD dependent epimerase/dehydratase [Hypoxylon sp. FL1857]|nr:NAD dependent epimerase/dehydratase [Hypoxylon sp. FL1857]
MPQLRIFVTAATGTQGGGVVRQCLRDGHDVFALVRDPSSQAAKALSELGAKLVEGTYDNLEALKKGMQNIDVVFLNVPGNGAKGVTADVGYTKNVIEAAKSASVPWFIYTSAVNTGKHESFPGWGPDHLMYEYWLVKHEIENLVRNAGFQHWTIVRLPNFLQNFKPQMSQYCFPGFKDRKVLKTAYDPQAKLGWIDASDMGKVVAKILSEPEKYSGKEIDIAAESVTIGELAKTIEKAIGKPVTVEPYTEAELAAMGPSINITAQRWASDVPTGDSAEKAAAEFGLTSAYEFFSRNREI